MRDSGSRAAPPAAAPLGVFDSGLGGLSVLREVRAALPGEDVVYFGDNAHIPYGPRTLDEVRAFCVAITGNLLRLPVKAIVVACNTASAAALRRLREAWPNVPFVGMEPAVKPAVEGTRSGKVGVLATQATFQGKLFESVVERFAGDAEVLCRACPGLAEFIEQNPPEHPELMPMLKGFIDPLIARGVDSLVLGCTHYPLVKDAIQAAAGPGVVVVDPSPAVARRVAGVLDERGLRHPDAARTGDAAFYASGDAGTFSDAASRILGIPVVAKRAGFSTGA